MFTRVNMQCTVLALNSIILLFISHINDWIALVFVLVTHPFRLLFCGKSIHRSKFNCKIHENLCNLIRIIVAVLNLCVVYLLCTFGYRKCGMLNMALLFSKCTSLVGVESESLKEKCMEKILSLLPDEQSIDQLPLPQTVKQKLHCYRQYM